MNGLTLGKSLTSVLFVIRLLQIAAVSVAMKTPAQDLGLSRIILEKGFTI